MKFYIIALLSMMSIATNTHAASSYGPMAEDAFALVVNDAHEKYQTALRNYAIAEVEYDKSKERLKARVDNTKLSLIEVCMERKAYRDFRFQEAKQARAQFIQLKEYAWRSGGKALPKSDDDFELVQDHSYRDYGNREISANELLQS